MATELPEVLKLAWERVGQLYVLNTLDGPSDDNLLGREADKWCSVVEVPDDLIGIDFLVLKTDGEIPGLVKRDWGNAGRGVQYYRTGPATVDLGVKAYDPVPIHEVEKMRPGARIKVKIGNMENDKLYSSNLVAYKSADLDILVAAIRTGIDLTKIERR